MVYYLMDISGLMFALFLPIYICLAILVSQFYQYYKAKTIKIKFECELLLVNMSTEGKERFKKEIGIK